MSELPITCVKNNFEVRSICFVKYSTHRNPHTNVAILIFQNRLMPSVFAMANRKAGRLEMPLLHQNELSSVLPLHL